MTMFDELAAPFPPERVSWRVGSVKRDGSAAMALAYIDARDVMERLDAVCGPDGWERRHPHVEKTTTCEIAIWIEGRGWVVKADGAGDTQVEAEKGSLSDSFKRAAVNWGVGRYLYDLSSPWVQIDQNKRILPSEIAKLEALLRRSAPPSAANRPQESAQPATLAEPPDPPEEAPAVLAANLAISLCKTSAELKAWWEEHKGQINSLPDPQYLLVSGTMRAKTAELKPKAVAHG